MRKIMIFAAVATMFAACTKAVGNSIVVKHPDSLHATIAAEASRVKLTDGHKLVWNTNDLVTVFYKSTAPACWKFDGKDGDTEGTLIPVIEFGEGESMAQIVAVYPSNDSNEAETDGSVKVVVPATQYDGNNPGNVMVARSDDDNLTFKSVVGWIELRLTGSKSVGEIVVKGNNGEHLAGRAKIGTDLSANIVGDESETISLVCSSPVALSETPRVFDIALVPQTLEKGITVTVKYTDGTSFEKSTSNKVAIQRNHIKPFKKIAAEAEPALPEVIKILAIGNSFSADAVEQELYPLFAAVNQKVVIGDLYIGGCPLDKHADNAATDAAAYSYRKIVAGTLTKTDNVKMSEALADEDWTFISMQEGAGYHGFYNTTYNDITHSMEPALTDLVKAVQEKCPKARLIYHAPWAAQKGYTGKKFSYYGFDQDVMNQMIGTATKEVLAAHPEFDLFMNSMDAVQNARTSYIGDNMNRDGWHLNYTTGRYTVGCLWFEKIMGQSVVGNPYHPSSISETTAKVCQTAAHEACEHPYTVTDLSYFEKPADEGGDDANKKVLAKWYFSPDRAVADGCSMTWTGQTTAGIYRYSLEAGERGYYKANETGSGKISYVQIDKTQWSGKGNCAGLSILKATNGGQPQMCGPMPGDYWQFETTTGQEFAEGTQLHIIYTYNPGSYGAKYWLIEYKDGQEFKPVPAFECKTETLALSNETITYNMAYTTAQKIIEFTVTLENPTVDFVVRQRCCSEYQVNNKWFDYPNVKCVSRIAGDPNNIEKPLPVMSQVL